MLLILNELTQNGIKILIWNIEETELALIKFLNTTNNLIAELLDSVSHPIRRKQKIVAKILLKMLSNELVEFSYNINGKPMLKSLKGHISISHSEKLVALIYHPKEIIGVDIEKPDERVHRISTRFLNETESTWVSTSPTIYVSLIWGIKESVFKAIGGGGINFKNNIVVSEPYEETPINGKGWVIYNKEDIFQKFEYHFRYLEDYLLVYTIAEN